MYDLSACGAPCSGLRRFDRFLFGFQPRGGDRLATVAMAKALATPSNEIEALRLWLLHMTLLVVCEVPCASSELISAYKAVGDRIERRRFEPFAVVFDRAKRNRDTGGSQPLVLVPRKRPRQFKRLQSATFAALGEFGQLSVPRGISTPHSTLLYGRGEVDRLIEPVSWQVDELVLIRSLVGRSKHEVVGQWPLLPVPDLFESLS
jgi:RNA 2',3'-cyclic 3'-phosphodiesterase